MHLALKEFAYMLKYITMNQIFCFYLMQALEIQLLGEPESSRCRFIMISVTIFGYFWKAYSAIYLTKSSQNIGTFLAILKNISFR